MKVFFLCAEGNSCRSLMAEAFLQEMDKSLEVYSAVKQSKDKVPGLSVMNDELAVYFKKSKQKVAATV